MTPTPNTPSAEALEEPVMWQMRWFNSPENKWNPWKQVKPRIGQTLESMLDEINGYIGGGKNYELRPLYTTPPVTAPIEKVDGLAEAVDRVVAMRSGNDAPYKGTFQECCQQMESDSALLLKAARLQLQRQGD